MNCIGHILTILSCGGGGGIIDKLEAHLSCRWRGGGRNEQLMSTLLSTPNSTAPHTREIKTMYLLLGLGLNNVLRG